MTRSRTLLLTATLALAGCMLPMHKTETTIRHEWPASGISRVRLEGMNGRMVCHGGPVDHIGMVARVVIRGSDPRGEVARKLIDMHLDNGTLVIAEKQKRGRRGMMFIPFFFRHSDATVDYELTVPASIDLTMVNVNGSMHIDGVAGREDLQSVNGSIRVSKPSGELTARTVNGAVHADFESDFRGARLKTVNGTIAVSLPADSSFNCDVSQVNGSFKSNFPLSVGEGSSSVEGTFNGGTYPLELSTVNGSVSVQKRDRS
jgi:hypothetical protein